MQADVVTAGPVIYAIMLLSLSSHVMQCLACTMYSEYQCGCMCIVFVNAVLKDHDMSGKYAVTACMTQVDVHWSCMPVKAALQFLAVRDSVLCAHWHQSVPVSLLCCGFPIVVLSSQ